MASAQIIIVRGPIAVGKTAVSQELAKLFRKVAVIPVDWLRHMVGSWNPENKMEAVLAGRNAAALAQNFCGEGYQVIIDSPFDDLEALSALLLGLQNRQVQVVTLAASWNEILRRHETRPENQRADLDRVSAVYHRVNVAEAKVDGMWIETEGVLPADAAKTILEGTL